jgi:GT2 family glycosyltransferase
MTTGVRKSEYNLSGNSTCAALLEKTDSSDQLAPLIVALVAVHNRLLLTQRCLCALVAATRKVRLHVVVIDDGSSDETSVWVKSHFPAATVLYGDGNLWFGGSVQKGLDYVRTAYPSADYVLILNNDSFMRPDSVDEMVTASRGDYSVAVAYWTEDLAQPNTAGFRWSPTGSFDDVCHHADWQAAHASGSRRFLPVDAVATTACLHPARTLARAALVNLSRHRQNRYDAVLSAHLRAVGARFLVSTHFLADHLYGPADKRPASLRLVSLSEFFRLTLLDPLSVHHVPYMIDAFWITAPSRWSAFRCIAHCTFRYLGQVGAKLLQAALAPVGIRLFAREAGDGEP